MFSRPVLALLFLCVAGSASAQPDKQETKPSLKQIVEGLEHRYHSRELQILEAHAASDPKLIGNFGDFVLKNGLELSKLRNLLKDRTTPPADIAWLGRRIEANLALAELRLAGRERYQLPPGENFGPKHFTSFELFSLEQTRREMWLGLQESMQKK